jgi:hypothetical protein
MQLAERPVQFADPRGTVDTLEVYKAMTSLLGSHLCQVPGGKTPGRGRWCSRIFPSHADLVVDHEGDAASHHPLHERYAVHAQAAEIEFRPLGHAAEAFHSYRLFRELRESGQIPDSVCFQVLMPRPITVVTNYIRKAGRSAVLPALATALLREFDRIVTKIPSDDLSFQSTVAVEFLTLETGGWSAYLRDEFERIVRNLVGLGNAFPVQAQLGFHFSCGDLDRTYLAQQATASRMFTCANALLGKIARSVDWGQVASPADRRDPEYFVPLAALRWFADAQIVLGLIHTGDDIDQAGHRLIAPLAHLPETGVAGADALNIQSLEQMREARALYRSVAEYIP